jgi:PAS domain S-box-containing protein
VAAPPEARPAGAGVRRLDVRRALLVAGALVIAYGLGLGPLLLPLVLIGLAGSGVDHGPGRVLPLLGLVTGLVGLGHVGIAVGLLPSWLDPVAAHVVGAIALGALWVTGHQTVRMLAAGERARRRLATEEAHVRALLAHASDVTTVVADGRITYVSPSTERLLGYRPSELVGRGYLDLIHPEDRERTVAFVRDLRREPGASGLVECRLRASDGRWIPVESSCRNLRHDPTIRGFVVNSRDVTERSTTRSGTRSGTRCSRRSPVGSARWCARPTPSPASVATSSPS